MGTLKGQNLRIYAHNTSGPTGDLVCIGMATSCTITLTNNTDNAQTKDDVGLAAKPVTTSKSWQVQVDSLDVSDVGAMLTAIKSQNIFILAWDESSTTDNQSPEYNSFARKGSAFLSDATFNFNDRENSAKSLTFIGASALQPVVAPPTPSYTPVQSAGYTKGQFVRLFLGSDNTTTPASVVAAAKQLSLHVSLTMESSVTKDTTGEWDIQEPTELSYDITTNALVRSGETISSAVGAKGLNDLETIYENGTPVKWQIANVSGANNRTKGSVIASGSAVLTQLTINAAVSNATYDAQLNGYGEYTVGS